MPSMDTTHLDDLTRELADADPAEAPPVAERLAEALAEALDPAAADEEEPS
jgi:hypothetical protein